jgi:hypothetical protein
MIHPAATFMNIVHEKQQLTAIDEEFTMGENVTTPTRNEAIREQIQ